MLGDSLRDMPQCQAVLRQQGGIDDDLVLFNLSSPIIDFAYARHGTKLPLDLPLLQILEFHWGHGTAESVLVKFAEGSCGKPQLRLNASGQLGGHLL